MVTSVKQEPADYPGLVRYTVTPEPDPTILYVNICREFLVSGPQVAQPPTGSDEDGSMRASKERFRALLPYLRWALACCSCGHLVDDPVYVVRCGHGYCRRCAGKRASGAAEPTCCWCKLRLIKSLARSKVGAADLGLLAGCYRQMCEIIHSHKSCLGSSCPSTDHNDLVSQLVAEGLHHCTVARIDMACLPQGRPPPALVSQVQLQGPPGQLHNGRAHQCELGSPSPSAGHTLIAMPTSLRSNVDTCGTGGIQTVHVRRRRRKRKGVNLQLARSQDRGAAMNGLADIVNGAPDEEHQKPGKGRRRRCGGHLKSRALAIRSSGDREENLEEAPSHRFAQIVRQRRARRRLMAQAFGKIRRMRAEDTPRRASNRQRDECGRFIRESPGSLKHSAKQATALALCQQVQADNANQEHGHQQNLPVLIGSGKKLAENSPKPYKLRRQSRSDTQSSELLPSEVSISVGRHTLEEQATQVVLGDST